MSESKREPLEVWLVTEADGSLRVCRSRKEAEGHVRFVHGATYCHFVPASEKRADDWDSAVADAPRWKLTTEYAPELGDHAWIVWCGTLQEQPWCWQELDDGRLGWVHGESEIAEGDGVTHWLPLPFPTPPADSEGK